MIFNQLNPVVDKIIDANQLKISKNDDPLSKINSITQIFIQTKDPKIFLIFLNFMQNDLKISNLLSVKLFEG